MKIDLAPLEGVTDVEYRRLHSKYYGGVDRYYIPFISPTKDHRMTPKEMRELDPARNPVPGPNGVPTVIPQLLTKSVDDFLFAAEYIQQLGYQTVNLNVGCPSGTVTAKGKGAGLLTDPVALDRLLDGIFSKIQILVSVKTRIGVVDPAEFSAILAIYKNYPLDELIIHPRTRKEMYRGSVHEEAYSEALSCCPFPVTYNGGILNVEQLDRFVARYPLAERVMIGRGLIMDPMLAERYTGKTPMEDKRRKTFVAFSQELLEVYRERFGNDRNVLFRMKELWSYWICLFEDPDGKYRKRLHKATTTETLLFAARAVCSELALRDSPEVEE